jgi:hypothetical protein
MRGWAFFRTALEEFHRSTAALATELGVVVLERLNDGFDLPERLITSGCANTATQIGRASCRERVLACV